MQLAVLSDIHGNLEALEVALADLERQDSVDMLWVLGDLAAFGPRPVECIQRVRGLRDRYGEDKVRYVRGNTDRYLVRGTRPVNPPAEDEAAFQKMVASVPSRDTTLNWALGLLNFDDYRFLAKLEREVTLEAPGYGWIVGYHGTPGDDEGFLRPETPNDEALDSLMDREGRMGIGGHIHVQMDRDLGTWRAINVGSVGMSFDQPGHVQWGLFTFEDGEAHVDLRRLPYDTGALFDDFRESSHPAPDWAKKSFRLA